MRRLRYCLSVGHRARSACCGALRCASSVTTRAEGAESAGPGNERGAASAPGTLSFEQAVKLSIGGLGQIAIPDALERGLSKALKGQGKTSLQGAARALQKQLRARAATRQRGGTVDIADVGMWRSPVPRRRDVDDDDIAEVEEDVRERLALEGVSMLDDRLGVVDVRQQRRVLREERKEKLLEYRRVAARPGRDTPYESTETKAYAAQRLPATYAACCRVLSEIRTRAPKFRPSRVLDFGAGPGAATWAVQDTWGAAAVEDALLVEPALAMMQLGRMIEGERAADVEAAGVMPAPSKQALEQRPCAPRTTLRWLAALPKMRDHKTGRSNKRKHDLVIASYVLAEIDDPRERQRIVRDLWARTKDVLVIVEPGTPIGFIHVKEARHQVLAEENFGATWDVVDAATGDVVYWAASAGPAAGPTGREPSSAVVPDQYVAGLESGALELRPRAPVLGAHVLAPCPGDGACPMDGRSRFCHFSQKFERTAALRAVKRRAGRRGEAARPHQDERFSFVVLRRGPRPGVRGGATAHVEPPPAAVLASDDEDDEDDEAAAYDSDGGSDPEDACADGDGAPEGGGVTVLSASGQDVTDLFVEAVRDAEDAEAAAAASAWRGPVPGVHEGVHEAHYSSLDVADDAGLAAALRWPVAVRPPRLSRGRVTTTMCALPSLHPRAGGAEEAGVADADADADAWRAHEAATEPLEIRSFVLPRSKMASHSRAAYRMARRLRWGDRYPAEIMRQSRIGAGQVLDAAFPRDGGREGQEE